MIVTSLIKLPIFLYFYVFEFLAIRPLEKTDLGYLTSLDFIDSIVIQISIKTFCM